MKRPADIIPWHVIFTNRHSPLDVLNDESAVKRAAEIAKMTEEAFDRGIFDDAFMYLGHVRRIYVLHNHSGPLISRGIYEKWLVDAYTHKPFDQELNVWRSILEKADRAKLRDCGEKMPSGEFHVLYRGTNDSSREINQQGMSWTSNPQTAAWFALKFNERKQISPAVYRMVVPATSVYFYTNERGEEEFVIDTENCGEAEQVPLMDPANPGLNP